MMNIEGCERIEYSQPSIFIKHLVNILNPDIEVWQKASEALPEYLGRFV